MGYTGTYLPNGQFVVPPEPPSVFWGKQEVAIDAFHHAVYAAATGIAYELISRPSNGSAAQ